MVPKDKREKEISFCMFFFLRMDEKEVTYKALFACKDYHGWFVEDFDQLNLSQIVHREIVEDPWLNLL